MTPAGDKNSLSEATEPPAIMSTARSERKSENGSPVIARMSPAIINAELGSDKVQPPQPRSTTMKKRPLEPRPLAPLTPPRAPLKRPKLSWAAVAAAGNSDEKGLKGSNRHRLEAAETSSNLKFGQSKTIGPNLDVDTSIKESQPKNTEGEEEGLILEEKINRDVQRGQLEYASDRSPNSPHKRPEDITPQNLNEISPIPDWPGPPKKSRAWADWEDSDEELDNLNIINPKD